VSTDIGFIPPALLKGTYTQTILASARIRVAGKNPMKEAAREMIMDVNGGIRLQGFFSPQTQRIPRGLVILLHGWEGSAESTYILHAGRCFYERGYAIFRLNLRDHGETHHLNEGLFYGTLLEEVYQAVEKAVTLPGGLRAFLMGFSLGGNFALRIAARVSRDATGSLKHVVAVSPVINPGTTTDAIDQDRLLRYYFMKKWRRSLVRKQKLFPHLYDFGETLVLKTIRDMTDTLLKRYGAFPGAEEYFRSYAIERDNLADNTVPTTIIGARDDPAIPVKDFSGLCLGPRTRLFIHDFGGHNGFLYGVFAPTWYERYAEEVFAEGAKTWMT
jgi:uncharacterized protein